MTRPVLSLLSLVLVMTGVLWFFFRDLMEGPLGWRPILESIKDPPVALIFAGGVLGLVTGLFGLLRLLL
jgi:hypothetical protein